MLTVDSASLSRRASGKRLLASHPTHTRIFRPIHFTQVVYIAPVVRGKKQKNEKNDKKNKDFIGYAYPLALVKMFFAKEEKR